jgi:predicted PurR-regulated permease PerM
MLPEKNIVVINTGTMLRALLVVLAAWFIYVVRDLIGILFVSLLLAAVIDPIAYFFEKKKIPSWLTVLIIYILLFVVLGVMLVLIIPPMILEIKSVAASFGSIWEKAVSSFDALKSISARYGLETGFQESIDALNNGISNSFAGLFSTITGLFGGLISFFAVLVISYFLVVEKAALKEAAVLVVPKRHHNYVWSISAKIQQKVGQWLIGQLILMLFVGVLSYVGLLAFGVKFALLLAIIAGFTEIIPYIGPVVATVPAVFFAVSDSPTKGVLILLFYLLVQRIENIILVPKVMQKATGLNPVFAVLALAVGFTVAGLPGGLLAIPAAAAANVVIKDYFERQTRA